MKSDDHPEYKMWNDACQAAETIFKTFKYNDSIEDKQKQLDHILLYYKEQLDKADAKNKKQRKPRKVVYDNVISIILYLDRHKEVIAMCKNYLDYKKLGKMSDKIIAKAKNMQAHLDFHGMDYCHNESNEEVNEEDIKKEELMISDEDEDIDGGNK